MIGLGGPERSGRGNPRRDAVTLGAQRIEQPLGDRFLFRRPIEYLGAVLVAYVGALTIDLRRIVNLRKSFVNASYDVFDGWNTTRTASAWPVS